MSDTAGIAASNYVAGRGYVRVPADARGLPVPRVALITRAVDPHPEPVANASP